MSFQWLTAHARSLLWLAVTGLLLLDIYRIVGHTRMYAGEVLALTHVHYRGGGVVAEGSQVPDAKHIPMGLSLERVSQRVSNSTFLRLARKRRAKKLLPRCARAALNQPLGVLKA
jgi:hypothetical protein